MRPLTVISLFLIGILPAQAFAADITPEGAAQLKTKFTQELKDRQDLKIAGNKAVFSGDVSVVPETSYYQVTLPNLKLMGAKGETITIGKIVMNMMPTDTPAEWKSSFSLPSPIAYTSGTDSGKATLEGQKSSGLWNMDEFGFTQMNSLYSQIRFIDDKTKTGMALSNLASSYTMTKSTTGFSGPAHVTADTLQMIDAKGQRAPLGDHLDITSEFQQDKNAKNGFTQTGKVEIAGLPTALKTINTKLKDPAQPGKANLQKALGVLTILQMSGRPTGDNGASSYDVVTDAAGRTIVNGVDVSVLLGAGSVQ